jgi:hypothetical protein
MSSAQVTTGEGLGLGVLISRSYDHYLYGESHFGDPHPHIRRSDSGNFRAVALRERFAASVSFQRCQPGTPPTQNVISVALRELSAGQFSGKVAKIVQIATVGSPFGRIMCSIYRIDRKQFNVTDD